MNEDKISNDTFASCLRQLVINCEPIIHDADSIQSVQESLQRLEENDENFYKYELVKLLKLQLNDKLGSDIDETIEQYPANRVDLNHAEMIDNMTSKLIYSSEYLKLSKKLKTIVTNANDYLLTNYDTEVGSKLKLSINTKSNTIDNSHKICFKQSQQEAQAIFNDNPLFSMQSSDEESSASSFFNAESCVFLNHEQMINLAEDLDGKKKSFAKRQEALFKLLRIPIVDIHCWDILEPGLIDSLNEPELYTLSIKFIAKGFISTPNNIKALYCTLVKQLKLLFTIKKYQLPTLRSGIDIRRQDVQRILISLRLINEFQQNAIHFWVRYSEKFLEDILESTLILLSINYKSLSLDSRPSPLHFLSLIDPRAEWMIKWTHGTYSRKTLLRYLDKYKGLLEESINCCLRYFSIFNGTENKFSQFNFMPTPETAESNSMSYTPAQIDYLYFIHSISIVMRTLMYKSYRDLLEKVLLTNSNTISSFMCSLIVFWFKTPEFSMNNSLDPHTICHNIIKTIVQDKKACKYCFCNTEFLGEIFRFLSPLKNFHNEELDNYLNKYQSTLCRLCDILSEMIQYKNIRVLFLSNPQKILIPQSAVELVGDLIHKNLTEKQFLSSNLLTKLISIVCQFYNGCEELHSIWSLNIHFDLVRAWKDAEENRDRCTTPTKDKSSRKIFQIISWEESLSENLLWLAKTRRGILFLEKHNAISSCLYGLLTKSKQNQAQIDRLPIGNIDLIINQIASVQSGLDALVSNGIVQRLIMEIWSLTECDPDDLPTYHGCVWPIQSMNISCLKPLVKLIAIHSSYSAFYNLIHGQILPMEDYYSFREIPKNLIMFIDRLVIVNTASKIHGLFNYESSHLCGLCWLSATVSNLNCLLLLESQFGYIQSLINSQNENKSKNNDFVIIDALSVERHNIIIKSLFLAGPSERISSSKRVIDITEKDILSLGCTTNFASKNYFRYSVDPICRSESQLLTIIRNYSYNNFDCEISISDFKKLYVDEIKLNNIKNYSFSEIMKMLDIILNKKLKSERNHNEKDLCQYITKMENFSKFEESGIKMIVDYGINLKLFQEEDTEFVINNFKFVLTNTKSWWKKFDKFDSFKEDYFGFDWFTGCIFLLCQGNEKQCIEFLWRFAHLGESITIWPMKSFLHSNENPLLLCICHWIEIIIAAQCPAVHSSFQICGYPLTEVCSIWFSQCFLNIFDWTNIVTFITSNILIGSSFSIYFGVSLLKHLEPKIKARLHNNDLIIFIREVVIDDFNLNENIEEILRYQSIYQDLICKDLKSIYECT